MNKIITGLIVLVLLFVVSFCHPLNAKENTYVFTPVDTIIKLEDVKQVGTYVYWTNIEYIKTIIDEFYKNGNEAASYMYKQYILAQIVLPIEIPGLYDVQHIETYRGFWIFIIK